MKINYLARDEINMVKWDASLYTAFNSMIYGYSWYLDEVCDDWGALVLDDYTAVMPLPFRSKGGIRYLYQPFFCQQLGIFSNTEITPALVLAFFSAIPTHFKFIDIQVNPYSNPGDIGYTVKRRVNFHLPLIATYEQLYRGYNENTRRNLKKAATNKIQLLENVSATSILSLYKENYSDKTPEIKNIDYSRLERLMNTCQSTGVLKTWGAFDEHNMLCAGALFLTDHKNIYYLLGGGDAVGKETGALHAVFDGLVKKYSGNDLIIDFEGSEIEGIARFYKGLGAQEVHYFSIKQNRLPRWLRWLKK